MVALWVAVGMLSLAVVLLTLKIFFMRRAAREIAESFALRLEEDTNTPITVSTGDGQMRALARALNRELRCLRRQRLQYLNGDRELKEAVTNISHDLRTPLTAICGYLDLLQKAEKSPNVSRYLDLIGNRVHVMRELTEEMLRYAVTLCDDGGFARDAVCLGDVLEESIAGMYAALVARGIQPEICISEIKQIRQLDRAALSRVLGNVLGNALKYSDGDLEVLLTDTGEIRICNRASALDEVRVGRLFDRFFSVESGGNSTGLGLSIARTLVERMGGSISAELKGGRLCISLFFPNEC